MTELWTELATKAGMTLSAEQDAQLEQYLDLLTAGNERMNLTRIIDRPTARVQHVGDALTLLPFIPAPRPGDADGPDDVRIVDVGSGGGVPGIPLAIARPDSKVWLIDSTKKKADFLRETCATLGLHNVTVLGERAEDVGRTKLRDSCDIGVARAVATIEWLVEWVMPLVRKGGKTLFMKGAKYAEELPLAKKSIHVLGGAPAIVHPVELPGTDYHVIVEIPKLGKTDLRYPREATLTRGKPMS